MIHLDVIAGMSAISFLPSVHKEIRVDQCLPYVVCDFVFVLTYKDRIVHSWMIRLDFYVWSLFIKTTRSKSWEIIRGWVKVICVLSLFSCVRLFATLWTVAFQAPLSMGFSRQEYWRGLPCPSPGDLPNPGTETESLKSPVLAGGFLLLVPPEKLNFSTFKRASIMF